MTHYTTTIEKPLSLDEARQNATKMANETGNPQPVYKIEEIETIQPSYIKGRWYYGENAGRTWICRLDYLEADKFYYSELYDNTGYAITNEWLTVAFIKGLANPEQIEAHLSAAAIKMGFKEGVTILTPKNKLKFVINSNKIEYFSRFDKLYIGCRCVYDGNAEAKWATIISEPEEVQGPIKNTLNPVLLSYRDEHGTLINIRATEVKINPLEGE